MKGWLGHPQYELDGGVILWFPGSPSSIIILEIRGVNQMQARGILGGCPGLF